MSSVASDNSAASLAYVALVGSAFSFCLVGSAMYSAGCSVGWVYTFSYLGPGVSAGSVGWAGSVGTVGLL